MCAAKLTGEQRFPHTCTACPIVTSLTRALHLLQEMSLHRPTLITQSPQCTLWLTLSVAHFMGLGNDRDHHCSVVQIFHCPKILLCATYSYSHPHSLTTTDLFIVSVILLFPKCPRSYQISEKDILGLSITTDTIFSLFAYSKLFSLLDSLICERQQSPILQTIFDFFLLPSLYFSSFAKLTHSHYVSKVIKARRNFGDHIRNIPLHRWGKQRP